MSESSSSFSGFTSGNVSLDNSQFAAAFDKLDFGNVSLPLNYKKPKLHAERVNGYYPLTSSASTSSSIGLATPAPEPLPAVVPEPVPMPGVPPSTFSLLDFNLNDSQPPKSDITLAGVANLGYAASLKPSITNQKPFEALVFANSAVHDQTKPLPFDGGRIAASPHTLRLARLWPKDLAKQRLLATIIEIAKEEQGECILTAPAAVAFARCGMRMAGHLIARAVEQGRSIDFADGTTTLFEGLRERTLHLLKDGGGWSAASRLPHAVVEEWWTEATQHWNESFPSSLENETEQAVCAAIVVEFLRLLLQRLLKFAVKEHVSLLSTVLLSWMVEIPESHTAIDLFKQIQCTITPDLEASTANIMQFTLTDRVVSNSSDSSFRASSFGFGIGGGESFGVASATTSRFNPSNLAVIEDKAVRFILDEDSWYHDPQLLHLVAQKVASGDWKMHDSDLLLRRLGCRLMKHQTVVLSGRYHLPHSRSFEYEFGTEIANEREGVKRVNLQLEDASGSFQAFVLETNRNSKISLCTDDPFPKYVVTSEIKMDGVHIKGQLEKPLLLQLPPTHGEPLDFRAALYTSPQHALNFHATLSATSEQALHHLLEGRNCINQLMRDFSPDELHNGRNLPQTASSSLIRKVDQFIKELQTDLSNHSLELLVLQIQDFLDPTKWGNSRYAEFQSDEVRRQFQSHLFDASMQAIGAQPLPTVLLELIADFYTIEALPYVSPQEQKMLQTQPQ